MPSITPFDVRHTSWWPTCSHLLCLGQLKPLNLFFRKGWNLDDLLFAVSVVLVELIANILVGRSKCLRSPNIRNHFLLVDVCVLEILAIEVKTCRVVKDCDLLRCDVVVKSDVAVKATSCGYVLFKTQLHGLQTKPDYIRSVSGQEVTRAHRIKQQFRVER